MMRDNIFSKNLSEWLIGKMKENNITQLEMADVLDTYSSNVWDKLHRGRKYTFDQFILICDRLGMDYSAVIEEVKAFDNTK